MSTSFGYILMADWGVAVFLLLAQVVVLVLSGYMSLASIISSILFAICGLLSGNDMFAAASVVFCALALYSHRENMKRLKQHRENKINPDKITGVSRKMVQKIKDRRNKK